MSLLDQLKRAFHFFSKENLAETPITYAPLPDDIRLASDLALVIIDVQKKYCDPKGRRGNKETGQIAKRIQKLAPEFRNAGIPVYVVYFSDDPVKPKNVDFYEFKPGENDILIRKNMDSAFQGSDIKEVLQQHGRKRLLCCGFNLNACVFATVVDGIGEGFNIRLLRDLTGNDKDNDNSNARKYVQKMKRKGAVISNAERELRLIRAEKAVKLPLQPVPATA
ncbi:MAG: cysteine hydrolase family protein [Alphaproteobacteria bacterium]